MGFNPATAKPIEQTLPAKVRTGGFDPSTAKPIATATAPPANAAPPASNTAAVLRAVGQGISKVVPIPPLMNWGAQAATRPAEFAGDVADSAANFAGGIKEAVKHPIENVIKPVAKIATAAGKSFVKGTPPSEEPELAALKDAVVKRYGSIEAFNRTVAKDPVGFAADASTALSAGGAATKLAGIPKLGATLAEAGAAIEPISAATRGVSAAVGQAGKFAKTAAAITASLETGKPSTAFITALEHPTPEYFSYLRDQKPPKALVEKVGEAMHSVAEKEGMAYRESLGKIKEGSDLASELDVTPIKDSVKQKLLDFGVERTGKPQTIKTPEGPIKLKNGLDFTGSSLQLNAKAQAEVARAVGKIDEIGVKPGSATPIQLDMTKRALRNLYSENSDARAFIQGVRSEVTKTLRSKVAGYQEMTSRYENYKDLADEFKSVLGNPDKQSANSVFTKLTSAMKENADFKHSVLEKFSETTGKDLRPALAGQALSTWVPSGMRSVLASGSLTAKAFGFLSTPFLWPALAMTSPRVMGEFLGGLGVARAKIGQITTALGKSQAVQTGLRAIPKLGEAGFQAERAKRAVLASAGTGANEQP